MDGAPDLVALCITTWRAFRGLAFRPVQGRFYQFKGHRIRVEVTSSSFPKYARNLNTGGRNEFEAEGVIATNTVRHARSEASYIVLPIVK